MSAEALQREGKIPRIVGGKAQLRATFHHARKLIQHRHLDEAPFVVARLGPGIGEENKDASKRGVRCSGDHIADILRVKTDIVEVLVGDPGQQLGHARDIGFGADQPNLRVRFRLPGQMLARAESCLEPDVRYAVCIEEVITRIAARFRCQCQSRQERFEQTRLPRAQLRPLAAAVMLAPEGGLRTRL